MKASELLKNAQTPYRTPEEAKEMGKFELSNEAEETGAGILGATLGTGLGYAGQEAARRYSQTKGIDLPNKIPKSFLQGNLATLGIAGAGTYLGAKGGEALSRAYNGRKDLSKDDIAVNKVQQNGKTRYKPALKENGEKTAKVYDEAKWHKEKGGNADHIQSALSELKKRNMLNEKGIEELENQEARHITSDMLTDEGEKYMDGVYDKYLSSTQYDKAPPEMPKRASTILKDASGIGGAIGDLFGSVGSGMRNVGENIYDSVKGMGGSATSKATGSASDDVAEEGFGGLVNVSDASGGGNLRTPQINATGGQTVPPGGQGEPSRMFSDKTLGALGIGGTAATGLAAGSMMGGNERKEASTDNSTNQTQDDGTAKADFANVGYESPVQSKNNKRMNNSKEASKDCGCNGKSKTAQILSKAAAEENGMEGDEYEEEQNQQAPTVEEAPSYEEYVPKKDFRRGTMTLGALGGQVGSFPLAIEASKRMSTPGKAALTAGGIGLGAAGLGALGGRLYASDDRYEEGREDYNKQIRNNPQTRKEVTKAYNAGKQASFDKEAKYEIVKESDGFYVVNKESGERKNKEPHDTKEEAREHQKALHANVKDASANILNKAADEDDSDSSDDDPCWDGYKQVGMKTKDGEKVPNCVPKDDKTAQILAKQATTTKEAKRFKIEQESDGFYIVAKRTGERLNKKPIKSREKAMKVLNQQDVSETPVLSGTMGGAAIGGLGGAALGGAVVPGAIGGGGLGLLRGKTKKSRERGQMRGRAQQAAQKDKTAQILAKSAHEKTAEDGMDNKNLSPDYESARMMLEQEMRDRAGKDPTSRMAAMEDTIRDVKKQLGDRRRKKLNRHREGDTENPGERFSRAVPMGLALTGAGALGGGLVGGPTGALAGGALGGGGYAAYEAARGPRKIKHPDETGLSQTALAAQMLEQQAKENSEMKKEIAKKPLRRERRKRERRRERRDRKKTRSMQDVASSLKGEEKRASNEKAANVLKSAAGSGSLADLALRASDDVARVSDDAVNATTRAGKNAPPGETTRAGKNAVPEGETDDVLTDIETPDAAPNEGMEMPVYDFEGMKDPFLLGAGGVAGGGVAGYTANEAMTSDSKTASVNKQADQEGPQLSEEAVAGGLGAAATHGIRGLGPFGTVMGAAAPTIMDQRSDEFSESFPDYMSRASRQFVGSGLGSAAGMAVGGLPGGVVGGTLGGALGGAAGNKAVDEKYDEHGRRKANEVIFGEEVDRSGNPINQVESDSDSSDSSSESESDSLDEEDVKDEENDSEEAEEAKTAMKNQIKEAYMNGDIDEDEAAYLFKLNDSMSMEKNADMKEMAQNAVQTLGENSDAIRAGSAGLAAAGSLAGPIQSAAQKITDPIRRKMRLNRLKKERPKPLTSSTNTAERNDLEREWNIPNDPSISDQEAAKRVREKAFKILHDAAPEVTRMPTIANSLVERAAAGGSPEGLLGDAQGIAERSVDNASSRQRMRQKGGQGLRNAAEALGAQADKLKKRKEDLAPEKEEARPIRMGTPEPIRLGEQK